MSTHRRNLDRGCGDVHRRRVPELVATPVQGKGEAHPSWTYVVTFAGPRQCSRLATRGIGPDRQSEGFSVRNVAELDAGFSEVVEQGPLNGKAMLPRCLILHAPKVGVAAATTGHLHFDLDMEGHDVEAGLCPRQT